MEASSSKITIDEFEVNIETEIQLFDLIYIHIGRERERERERINFAKAQQMKLKHGLLVRFGLRKGSLCCGNLSRRR